MTDVDVSVVVPCLNEAGLVGPTVRQAREALARAGLSHEVVVCDNGSADGSAAEAEAAGAVVVVESRRGYGAALMGGFAAARGHVLVMGDADGTYPLDETPAFVERVRSGGGLVMGSRFRGEILPGSMPLLHRLVGSPATRVLLRVLFRVRSSDPHCGMRAMSRETYEAIKPSARGMEFAIEMVVNATRRKVPISEIPVTYHPRKGISKLRALPDGWALLRFLLLHSPTFLYLVPGFMAVAVGIVGLAWLTGGDRTVGSVTFSLNSMVVSALIAVAGYQAVTLGLCARAYTVAQSTEQGGLRWFRSVFSLERGLLAGMAAVVGGVVLLGTVGVRWLSSDFGRLPLSDNRLAIAGLTAAVAGMQTIFSSFFVSLFLREDVDL